MDKEFEKGGSVIEKRPRGKRSTIREKKERFGNLKKGRGTEK
jgi:hypothetical protein